MLFTFRLCSVAKLLFVLAVLLMIRMTIHALDTIHADADRYHHTQLEPKK
jgi:hypothetical protein